MPEAPPPAAPSHSTKAMAALVCAISSLLASPVLFFAQYFALIGVATVSSEPSNPTLATVALVAISSGLAVLAFTLPLAALVLASRARREIKGSTGSVLGAPTAMTAQVIAAVDIVALLIGEVFIALSLAGVCGLDGCS